MPDHTNVEAYRQSAVDYFRCSHPLTIGGAFFLPVEGRAGAVPVVTSTEWH